MIDDVYVRQRFSIYDIPILGSTSNSTVNHSNVKTYTTTNNRTILGQIPCFINIINNINKLL